MNQHRKTPRLLVVDDEPFVLRLLAQQLASLGFPAVETCERAGDALARLDGNGGAVDIVFCDLDMPEMDGVEFVRALAGSGFRGHLVLISGEDPRIIEAAGNLARGHRLEVLGALGKPVATAALKHLLARFEAHLPRPERGARKGYDADAVRGAIQGGQIGCHFQPQVEVASGRVVGAEALARWQHPEDGMVFPDQFIPVAEEHGLIDALTASILDVALGQLRAWRDRGLDLHVSVNVSMDNLTALDFPDLVWARIQAHGVPVSRVLLEVTESRLSSDRLAAVDILTRLRLKRIGLSIDDFGTGHSSLSQLRDMPFDEIKIDRSFVHRAHCEPSLRAILEASLAMAAQLRMRAVAEGVEDEDDWDYLRRVRCDLAQGYFIARPMPGESLPGWIESRQQHGDILSSARPDAQPD